MTEKTPEERRHMHEVAKNVSDHVRRVHEGTTTSDEDAAYEEARRKTEESLNRGR